MKKFFVIILFVLLYALIAYSGELFDSISLIQLIANPDVYDGNQVCVSGYLHNRKESSALYLSRIDADYQITKNAVAVIYAKKVNIAPIPELKYKPDLKIDHFDSKYVKLYGTFAHKFIKGTEKYSGTLYEVTKVEEIHRVYSERAVLKQHIQKVEGPNN